MRSAGVSVFMLPDRIAFMPLDRVEVVCPAGHRYRVLSRHLGKSVRCTHDGCRERFTLRPAVAALAPTAPTPTTAAPSGAALATWRPSSAAPLLRDTIQFHDLQQLIQAPMMPAALAHPAQRTLPAPQAQAAPVAPSRAAARRRPWFALACLVATGVFAFCAPVRPCGDCGGAGQFGGRVLYRNTSTGLEPAGTTPMHRCGHCSGAGRITPYQLVYDWLVKQRLL